MAYLLDADAFIAANNLHYGLDFCPAFCDWLVAGHESERVFSVEKVGDEVQALGDELSEWAEARGNGFSCRRTLRSSRRWPRSVPGRTAKPTSQRL